VPSSSFDFVSPSDVIGITTAFFDGKIDLDPASSKHANSLVCADRFFTEEDNGLKQSWKAKNIYLYPPREFLSGNEQPESSLLFVKRRKFQKSKQRVWLEETYRRYMRQEFEEAVVFITSADVALRVTQKIGLDLPMCVMKDTPKLSRDEQDLPELKNVRCIGFLLYFPSPKNYDERINTFIKLYSLLGRVYC
jgi:hypothetical protein